jgi:hypothetical protein
MKKKNRPVEIDKIKRLIETEHPELTVAHKGYVQPLFEQIKAFYEIKMIESQKIYNRTIIFLTIIVTLLTILNLYLTFFK